MQGASTEARSPFRAPGRRRFGFGTKLIMMLMVVAAGFGLLVYNALRVPDVSAELNAWLGRPDAGGDAADGRRLQLMFALFCYTGPLALGLLVSLLHGAIAWLESRRDRARAREDEPFRMD